MFHTRESIKCHVTAMPWGVTGKQYPKSEEREKRRKKKGCRTEKRKSETDREIKQREKETKEPG